MSLIKKAEKFAKNAHDSINQKRKYTGEPYWVHCEDVANIVQRIGGSEEMIAAAWLHDTVEDTPVTLDIIRKEFGEKVAKYVECLTDVSKKEDGNRAKRKQIDLEHTKLACVDSKTIKLADLISNGRDIVKRDPNFAKVYIEEKIKLLEVLKEGNKVLYQEALEIINSYKSSIS